MSYDLVSRRANALTFALALALNGAAFADATGQDANRPTLEFRIVATEKHDAAAFARAVVPDGARATPDGYRWVRLGNEMKEAGLPGSLIRADPAGGPKWLLVKLDPQNVTSRDFARVYAAQDGHFQPAIGFAFTPDGGRRFGALTRAHLPEDDGAFKHQMAIILEGVAHSAPMINSEIRDQGIIEFGTTVDPKEVDRVRGLLAASVREKTTARAVGDQAEAIRLATEVDLPAIAELADRVVLLPARGGDAVVLTKPEDVAELRRALKPREVPPSGGLTAATIAFYQGTSMVRSVWIYEGGEWGFERPGTSWTTGASPELWEAVRRRLKK